MRFGTPLLPIVAFAVCLSAQSFEVASIRINKDDQSGAAGKRIRIETSPGSLVMRNVTLLSCIRWAYDVHDYQIVGGPEWRNSERYDIIARPPAAASEDQMKQMLRALLAERFKLALTHEKKELPAYVITVDKNGHRLKPSKGDGQRGLRPADGGIALVNTTMADLEQFLSGLPLIDKRVIDRTGLTGPFDFTLILSNDSVDATPGAAKGALVNAGAAGYIDALKRLGLKMDLQKVPIENVIIDHVEKPSEN
jgi:uncharacterized protein (TIGR03435 family)